MRILKYLALAGLILAVTGTAGAITLNLPGPVGIKFDIMDWTMSKTYALAPGQVVQGIPALDALVQGPPVVPGAQVINVPHLYAPGLVGMTEDDWSIVKVSQILVDEAWDPNSPVVWSGAADLQNEIVGLVYGGVDSYVADIGAGKEKVGTVGLFYDFYVQPKGTFQASLGSAGRIGFSQYVGAGLSYTDLNLNGKYDAGEPTFAVGQQIIAGQSTFGKVIPGAVVPVHRVSEFTPAPFPVGSGTGESSEFVDIVGGAWRFAGPAMEVPNFYFPNVDPRHGVSQDGDLFQKSTLTPYFAIGTPADWIVSSDDPVRGFAMVPEPFTMLTLATSLFAVGGYVRRRLA